MRAIGPLRPEAILEETRLARRVTHPGICRVFDVAVEAGETFISMEWVDGEDLRSLFGRHAPLGAELSVETAGPRGGRRGTVGSRRRCRSPGRSTCLYCAAVRLRLVPVVALLLAFLPAAPALATGDVLLVTLDTTRPDHLSCYAAGRTPATSPNIDLFAKGAVRFRAAYTPTPYTLPAHASMLTGRWPKDHGLRDNVVNPAGARFETVAGRLRGKGYRTEAVVGSFVLDSAFGLARGFDVYDDRMTSIVKEDPTKNERPAEAVEARALELVAAAPADKPLFLWVHFFDVHFPYAPHPDTPPGMGLYDGEIRHVDASVGRLLAAWEKRRHGLVVVAGDHGEALGEHGEDFHGIFLYEATVHVPLLVRAEGRSVPGVDDRLASLTDVAATILDFAGIAPGKDLAGRSLLSTGTLHERLFFESFVGADEFGWSPPFAVRSGPLKYVQLPRPELYDLDADPGETKNLVDLRRPKVRELAGILKKEYGTSYAPPEGSTDPAVAERLRSLGYIASGSNRAGGADPKDLIDVIQEIFRAEGLKQQGKTADAEALLRKVLARDPTNVPAMIELADLMKTGGRRDEAKRLLRGALRTNERHTAALLELALLDEEAGAFDEAGPGFEAVLRLQPEQREALVHLAWLAWRRGAFDQASGYLDRVARITAEDADYLYIRGLVAEGKDDAAGAAAAFSGCLRLAPRNVEAAVGLAEALHVLGRDDEAIAAYRKVLALDPERPDAVARLATFLSRSRGGREEARRLAEGFLARWPTHPEAPRVRELLRSLPAAK